jgi:EAL and modified HD-GYP domain-containing signal transduction protein
MLWRLHHGIFQQRRIALRMESVMSICKPDSPGSNVSAPLFSEPAGDCATAVRQDEPAAPLSFLGLQPIIHRNGNISAYEVLYRDGRSNKAAVVDSTAASSHVIATVLGHLGVLQQECHSEIFINVGEELLFSDLIELLPPARSALEILETVKPSETVIARCRQLRERGYTLVLDDFVFDHAYAPLIDLVSIVKADIRMEGIEEAENTYRRVKAMRPDVVLLAEKVETQEEFQRLKQLGFELFQGYFFARPEVRAGRCVGPSLLTTLRALEIVIREGDMREIEEFLKKEPGLSLGVLRLANSVAASSRSKSVQSLKQAAMLLGWKQLRRYLEVVLLARHAGSDGNALMQLMVARGDFMEELAPEAGIERDSAYLIGLFSLADRLLGLPMEQILAELHLALPIERALLRRDGEAGCLLALCEALEGSSEIDAALFDQLAGRHGLSREQILAAKARSLLMAAELPL